MKLVACLALARSATAANWGDGNAQTAGKVPASFDCAMRKAAYDFGKSLVPRLQGFEALYYALDLNSDDCHEDASLGASDASLGASDASGPARAALPGDAVFVAVDGDAATGDGSFSRPLKALQAAYDLAATRASKTVVLRGGTHYLKESVVVEAKHSGLRVTSYPGERSIISGGVELDVDWQPERNDAGLNLWATDLKGQIDDVPGLQINGARSTRARYPNLPGGIEVSCGYGCMLDAANGTWTPPDFDRFGEVEYYTDHSNETAREDTPDGWFQHYMVGRKGLCSVYDPPVSYWCSEKPSGGGAFAFRTPSGVAVDLPHGPYDDPTSALFFVWRPSRWANWMFDVAEADGTNYTFGRGGNQGARGSDEGGDFFVENVREELDFANEFFFDKAEGKLYLVHNGTGAPPSSGVVVPRLKVLLNLSGSQWAPVANTSHEDLTFTAARYTYMDPHGVPSAGDWALDRVAAVFLQGTSNAVFDGCVFDRLDGNALMVSGHNRFATITRSDFAFIGGNAIAAWGYTNETETDPGRPGVVNANWPRAGVDGTDGEHPYGTTVAGCTAREVGLYEKQSSFYVQAKTAASKIQGNVFFNGPRAGINANDGFGGGDVIAHNLVFSTCRESGDHGPFNSWDRQPYLTTVRTGEPSMIMDWRHIHHNFFIDNYSPQENVDNDDGSCYYHTHDNFLVYGGRGMKNDFGGHDNWHFNNTYAYAGMALSVTDTLHSHEDHFYSNRVVLTASDVGNPMCSAPKTVMAENQYFTPDGKLTECKTSLEKNQEKKHMDLGSTVAKHPDDATIIGWAKATLGF